jgi:hypothetical protein
VPEVAQQRAHDRAIDTVGDRAPGGIGRPPHLLLTRSYGAIDGQFYPNGIEGWMVKLDANPQGSILSTRNSTLHGRSPIARIK